MINNINLFSQKCLELRIQILEMCYQRGGHISSSYSCVELMAALFYKVLVNYNVKNFNAIERDRFILSKGHSENTYYAILADLGFFPQNYLLSRYRAGDCFLGGHPSKHIPGVEVTSGALGHGLGIGCGMAKVQQLRAMDSKTYVLLGDAECTEGSVWEAALFANTHKLNNLIAIVDDNKIGATDFCENFTSLGSLGEKWKSFGWEVFILPNGNDMFGVLECFQSVMTSPNNLPKVVIANTIKGFGVPIFENDPKWHSNKISSEDYEFGMKYLKNTRLHGVSGNA